jgi:hypothetical protein
MAVMMDDTVDTPLPKDISVGTIYECTAAALPIVG